MTANAAGNGKAASRAGENSVTGIGSETVSSPGVPTVLSAINDVFHVKSRLGIMTLLLANAGESDFSTLKAELGLTDGNLGAHIRVLEEAGFVNVQKGFAGRRPRTLCRLSKKGRGAFLDYLRQLEAVIQMANLSSRE